MEKFKQKIKYDNGSIIQQNQIFPEEYQCLGEYISNSIDAGEDFYDSIMQEYSRAIKIEIIKINGNKNEQKIIIKDNASGMKINPNKAYTIFHSSKRNDPRTAGTYGMGNFAGYNLCNNIQFETRRKNGDYFRFSINAKTFKVSNNQSPEIEILKIKAQKNDVFTGTTVTLSSFKEGVFNDIDLKVLKNKIEKYFEQILNRKNIKITLKEDDKDEILCQGFKYSDFSDNAPYTKTIDTLYITNSKKFKTEKVIDISKNPVKVLLAVTKNRDLNRRPYIALYGRWITEVSSIEHFRTAYKYPIWSRNDIYCYIDATSVLETTPARREIKKTELSKAFFYTLSKLEAEILQYIESQSVSTLSERFQSIEEKINEILRDYSLKTETADSENKFKEYVINGYRIHDTKTEKIRDSESSQKTSKPTFNHKKVGRNHKATIKFPDKSGEAGNLSKTLSFKIDDINEPYRDENGLLLRSIIRDNSIFLFQKHEEFSKRVFQSAKGYYEFDPRSIHYITIEILTHLKEVEIRNKDEPYENLYRDFATEVYKLEEKLNGLNGERI